METKRSTWLAGLLNGVCPGAGFLYVGRPGLALVLAVMPLPNCGVIAWSRLIMTPVGIYLALLAYLATWASIDCAGGPDWSRFGLAVG